MEKVESTFRYLTTDPKGNQVEVQTKSIPLSKEKQEYIKRLMFSALEDPREKYEKVDMDDLVDYWKSNALQGC